MKIKNLAVIVTTDEDKAYQVALTDEKIESLISDLRNLYFSDGVIKIIDNELSGLEIVTRKELNKKEEQKSDSIMSDIIICCNASCEDEVHREGSVYCKFHASM